MITLVSKTVENLYPNKVVLTFDKELNELSIPAIGSFTLAGKTISNVSISGMIVTLTVTVPYIYGDSISLSYTQPETNKIKIPYYLSNKVSGSSDKLKVHGSIESLYYESPNTTAYKNADADFIWFDNIKVKRFVSEPELIGSDFVKTFVLYDDDTPNAIREILIQKAGEVLSESEMINIRTYCRLSIFWDDTLSEYGYSKYNRDSWRNVWVLSLIGDSHTLGWYNIRDVSKVTKDNNNLISLVSNIANTGIDLVSTVKPTFISDGASFTRATSATLKLLCGAVAQPISIYLIFKLRTWTEWDNLITTTGNILSCSCYGTTPTLGARAGGQWRSIVIPDLTNFHVFRLVLNGALAEGYIDSSAFNLISAIGNNGLSDLFLGAATANGADFVVAGLLVRNHADSLREQKIIYDKLKTLYGL